MKNKILNLILGLSFLVLPSLGIGIALDYLLSISWWAITIILISLQIGVNYYLTVYKEQNSLIKSVSKFEEFIKRYEELKYKKYRIPLTCQACGRENTVELDLTNTEFKCKYCERNNAIYVNFSTAITTEPLLDPNDVIANAT